jgi:uncharacterized membrane protein (UPF0127 family)
LRRAVVLVCITLILFGAVNCTAASVKAQDRLETLELHILRGDGSTVLVTAEIARTEEQLSQGLMGRKSLEDGKGMLFVFQRDRILSFWMKDTLIPLSIAFITSDGRILEIYDMQALDLKSVKSTRSARYALEVPQGWFTRSNIIPGDSVGPDLPE